MGAYENKIRNESKFWSDSDAKENLKYQKIICSSSWMAAKCLYQILYQK